MATKSTCTFPIPDGEIPTSGRQGQTVETEIGGLMGVREQIVTGQSSGPVIRLTVVTTRGRHDPPFRTQWLWPSAHGSGARLPRVTGSRISSRTPTVPSSCPPPASPSWRLTWTTSRPWGTSSFVAVRSNRSGNGSRCGTPTIPPYAPWRPRGWISTSPVTPCSPSASPPRAATAVATPAPTDSVGCSIAIDASPARPQRWRWLTGCSSWDPDPSWTPAIYQGWLNSSLLTGKGGLLHHIYLNHGTQAGLVFLGQGHRSPARYPDARCPAATHHVCLCSGPLQLGWAGRLSPAAESDRASDRPLPHPHA